MLALDSKCNAQSRFMKQWAKKFYNSVIWIAYVRERRSRSKVKFNLNLVWKALVRIPRSEICQTERFCAHKLLLKILLKIIVFVWRKMDSDIRVIRSNKYKYNFKDDILLVRRISSIIKILSSCYSLIILFASSYKFYTTNNEHIVHK